eukprot:365244-Chlamydomonas_euryale.AAC.19
MRTVPNPPTGYHTASVSSVAASRLKAPGASYGDKPTYRSWNVKSERRRSSLKRAARLHACVGKGKREGRCGGRRGVGSVKSGAGACPQNEPRSCACVWEKASGEVCEEERCGATTLGKSGAANMETFPQACAPQEGGAGFT